MSSPPLHGHMYPTKHTVPGAETTFPLLQMFRIHIVYTYWAHKSRSVDDKHAFIIGVLRLLFLTGMPASVVLASEA